MHVANVKGPIYVAQQHANVEQLIMHVAMVKPNKYLRLLDGYQDGNMLINCKLQLLFLDDSGMNIDLDNV